VVDTDVAWTNFDGIVYGKGAAIVKQMLYMVGRDNFSRAMTKYFDRFGEGTATIEDLLADMEPYFPAGVDVQQWMVSWLETPSLDVFEPAWDSTDKSANAVLTLKHTAFNDKYPTLRTHKMKIIFIDATGSIVDTKEELVSGQA
jgi:aminopeptidase N